MMFLRQLWRTLLLCLLTSSSLRAQSGHAYWDARPDSLRQLLARPQADTTRLRTLEHLATLTEDEHDLSQAVALLARLPRPVECRAYRLWLYGLRRRLPGARLDSVTNVATRDSLQRAVALLDQLGRPTGPVLYCLNLFFIDLHQAAERRRYFTRQLATCQRRGNLEGLAACYHVLAGCDAAQGDYNRSLSYLLQAAELGRRCNRQLYYNELGVIATKYSEWGNYARAQHYFQLALQQPGASWRNFLYCHLTSLHLRQRQLPQALAAANEALRLAADPSDPFGAYDRTYALVLKSQVLLALGQGLAAGRLLRLAQQANDSLHIRLVNTHNSFELDAAWAQYYATSGEAGRAEAAWQRAYQQARQGQSRPLQLAYLRQLARFYAQQHRLVPAAQAALAALQLADSLAAGQGQFHVAYFEQQQAEQRQAQRLRAVQAQGAARARRQSWLLGGLVLGASGLALVAGWQWVRRRRQQQAHAQLTRTHQQLARQQTQLTEQAARLAELDTAKNQFFANVSHELRTPLTLVLGPLQGLLTAETGASLPAAIREPVALAFRHASRLRQLVDRILDLTKLEAGRLVLHPVPTDLAPLLRRVVEQFDSLATERGLTLVAPTALPEGLRLLLDAEKVEHILTNLLINALNHTSAGGAVLVTAATPDPAGQVAVTVRDTGPGIAPSEQERVFERFYQSPQAQAQGGTGLGLALSRELATLLGGTLTLASELGQGAAFTLRFPAEVLPPPTVAVETLARTKLDPILTSEHAALPEELPAGELLTPPSEPETLPHSRLLVVEDQSDLRTYLRQLLLDAGYEVVLAEDGQAARQVLAEQAPVDLLVTDAMMPRLSGTELLTQLKADPTQAGLPVLMLTARADEAHRLQALAVGVDDYLTKPFAPAELLARVRALLARHHVRRHFAAQSAARALEPVPELVADQAVPPVEVATPAAAQLAQWQAQVADALRDPAFGPTELAAHLCLSERTLYRRLAELAGLTPAAWLRELRLHEARRLLESGKFGSVAAVAEAAGFANAKSFGQRYAARFGRRPIDYRT